MTTCRILLADDHAIVRRGLRYLLMAEIGNLQLIEVSTCADLKKALVAGQFDAVVLDLVLPDGNTIDLLPELTQEYPGLRILMYSMSAEQVYAERAVQLGAMGFVNKVEEESELVRAIRLVLRGKPYRSERQEIQALEQRGNGNDDPFASLSERELSTMHHLLRGRTVGEIAVVLGVGNSTAATYKARLMNKLGVSNLLELQRKADMHGYRIS